MIKKMSYRIKYCVKYAVAGLLLIHSMFTVLYAQKTARQQTEWLRESVDVHLPVRGYMPGDYIWFKLYVRDEVNDKLSAVSKTAYVELTDPAGTIVWQSKLAIENGAGYGSWRIPASLSTGVYLLRSYTHQQLLAGTPLQVVAITILNPLRGLQHPFLQPVEKAANASKPGDEQFLVDGIKTNYGKREAVQFSLSGVSVSSVSVAVHKVDSLETLIGDQVFLEQVNPMPDQDGITEYGGHLIRGRVTDRKGKPLEGIRIFLTVPGKKFYFNNSISDASGRVQFEVRDVFGTEQVIAYPAAAADSGLVITLDNPFYQKSVPISQKPIIIEAAQQLSLNERTAEFSLRQLFPQSVKERYFYPWQQDSTAFFGDPDKVYLLDDYTRFRTLEEVFREYVPEVDLKKIQGEFRVRLLNQSFRRLFDGNPLVLLDGVAVNDINRLMSIDPLKIRKLELVTRRYFLGDMAFEGILSMTTYEGDLGGFSLGRGAVLLDYPTMQLQQQFSSPVHNASKSFNSRTPDLRNILLWEPEAAADETGTIPVLFYTGDLSGEFVVDIKGYSTTGKLIHERRSFGVHN
jgi:hypothetical protein